MIEQKGFTKHWKKASTIVTIWAVLVTIALMLTASHWWKRCSGVQITCDGQPCTESKVYRSRNGHLLVSLADGMYIVFPERQEIGMTSPSNFFALPGYVYSRNVPPPFALMSPVKSVEPNLVVRREYIEFNSINEGRVHVTW